MRCSANHLALSPVNLIPGPSNSNAFQNEILVFDVDPKSPPSRPTTLPPPLHAREDTEKKRDRREPTRKE